MRIGPLILVLSSAALAQTRSFERVVPLEEESAASAGVHIGDLNGDGLLDIVLAKGRHGPLYNRVLLNNGRGVFKASNLSETPDRTYSAALADLDLDGDLDIVVTNDEPDRKLIYKNDGKGKFAEAGTFGEPKWSTRYVTVVDVNKDRYPDIAVANRGQPSYVCFNNRKAEFPRCEQLPTTSTTSITAADFDGDGAIDLFAPHRDGGQSVVLWNDGTGRFTLSTEIGPPATWSRIACAADFNNDGTLDIAFIEERKKATFIVYGAGRRRFGEPVRIGGADRTPYALGVADLNKDGKPDIVVGNVDAPGSIFFNGSAFQEVLWNDGQGVVYGIAFADFNGDRWPDIAAARSGAPNGIWFSGAAAPRKN
ncbi:MAG: FG-GAP repeat domain-containing protein [Bryobacteraceae bacterium]